VVVPTSSPVATPASLGDVLSTRGAVDRVYLALDDAVWMVASDGEAARIFSAPATAEIVAIDPSPSAQDVAVLLRGANGRETSELLILDSSGEPVARIDDFETAVGTPVRNQEAGLDAVNWSPQGDRVLVATRNGEILTFDLEEGGERTILDAGHGGVTIQGPAWSPTGESIAYIATTDSGDQTLRVLDSRDGTASDIVSPPADRLVVEFAWMPDGVSLLFTEGGEPGAATTGIDLWRVDADGENRELVASAGTVAPVARITSVRPSPDGRSVAYAVLVPGPAGPRVDSVWVRDLASRLGFRVAMPSVAALKNIWWTDNGVVPWVRTDGQGQGRAQAEALLQIKPDGSIAVLWAAPIAQATPVAATPRATPVEP
jgi:WD40 repeat protein